MNTEQNFKKGNVIYRASAWNHRIGVQRYPLRDCKEIASDIYNIEKLVVASCGPRQMYAMLYNDGSNKREAFYRCAWDTMPEWKGKFPYMFHTEEEAQAQIEEWRSSDTHVTPEYRIEYHQGVTQKTWK